MEDYLTYSYVLKIIIKTLWLLLYIFYLDLIINILCIHEYNVNTMLLCTVEMVNNSVNNPILLEIIDEFHWKLCTNKILP